MATQSVCRLLWGFCFCLMDFIFDNGTERFFLNWFISSKCQSASCGCWVDEHPPELDNGPEAGAALLEYKSVMSERCYRWWWPCFQVAVMSRRPRWYVQNLYESWRTMWLELLHRNRNRTQEGVSGWEAEIITAELFNIHHENLWGYSEIHSSCYQRRALSGFAVLCM